MGQRMNEENQKQDQKDEIAGKQEEPGQIVSAKGACADTSGV